MTQNHDYRIQRGRLLKILDKNFPNHVHRDTVSLTLQEMHFYIPAGVLKGHCEYLREGGYVEIDGEDSILNYTVKITKKGIDLLEENIPADPGVQI